MSDNNEASSRIRVAIRVRPFLESELSCGYTNSCLQLRNQQILVADASTTKAFQFDHAFPETATQAQVYGGCDIDHMVDRVVEGYHSTIFAYGQTGSGKTHTMQGAGSEDTCSQGQLQGIIPRVTQQLFSKIKQQNSTRSFTVSVSFLQIYNERIYDLLNPACTNPKTGAPGLRLRWNKSEQFSVENLFVFECKSAEELNRYFAYGLKNRVVASHKLNVTSSRSHSILTLKVDSFDFRNPASLLTSKFELVDLAGSERIGQTGTEGKLAKQSIDINKSLFTLRQVISTLADLQKGTTPSTHIPYRDSKLTSILKQSVGGNSYCLMIACISPNDTFLEENLSTLTYATKATLITNRPRRNADPRGQAVEELVERVKQLSDELSKANREIELLTEVMKQDEVPKMSNRDQNDTQFMKTMKNWSQQGTPGNLIESIHMVRELLRSNKELRETLEIRNQTIEKKDFDIYDLQKENEKLRDQIAEQSTYIDTLTGKDRQSTPAYRSRVNSIRRRVEAMNTSDSPKPIIFQSPSSFLEPTYSPVAKRREKTQTFEDRPLMRSTLRSYDSLQRSAIVEEPALQDLPTHFGCQQAAKDERQHSHNLQFKTLYNFGGWKKPQSQQKEEKREVNLQNLKKMSKTGVNFRRRASKGGGGAFLC